MIRALLGGSFDPVHNGHLAMVRRVLAAGLAQDVVVLPAGRSPHKGRPLAEARHRLAMLELAFGGEPSVLIDERELQRAGPSYTVESLAQLAGADPAVTWRLVVGLDNLADFPTWCRPQQILDLADLIVLSRPSAPGAGPAPPEAEVEARLQAEGLQPRRVILVGDFDEPVSSRQVRAMLAAGKDAAAWLPPAVAHYIRTHRLYGG